MNFKEIVDKLEKLGITKEDFGYGDIPSHLEGIGNCEELENVGGEGQGDYCHSVMYFSDHDVYIKLEGFYSSYEGKDFSDNYYEEVRPKQKTITVYE